MPQPGYEMGDELRGVYPPTPFDVHAQNFLFSKLVNGQLVLDGPLLGESYKVSTIAAESMQNIFRVPSKAQDMKVDGVG